MKKIILTVILLAAMVSAPAAATFPGLLGGADGYLALAGTEVTAFFNATEGQVIMLGGYSDGVEGLCYLYANNLPNFPLGAVSIPSEVWVLTAPYTDLYAVNCVYDFGPDGYIQVGAVDYGQYLSGF